jgi:hypothetical protein
MPSSRSRKVSSKPLMTDITTFSVITASMTPNIEITVISEMKVSRRRARKYLSPINSS